MIRLLLSLFILLYISTAWADSLVNVQFTEKAGTMYFTFAVGDGQKLSTDQIRFKADRRDRITFMIEGHKAKRAWKKKWKSKYILRSLLHPSQSKNLAYLKVRMKTTLPKGVLKRVQVNQKDKHVEVIIPYKTKSKARATKVVKAKSNKKKNQSTPKAVAKSEPPVVEQQAKNELDPTKEAKDKDADQLNPVELTQSQSCKGYPMPDQHAPQPGEINAIYEELALTQIGYLDEYGKYPRILALPVHLIDPKDQEELKYVPELSTHLLDGQMHHRSEVIWIDDQHIRHHSAYLADERQALDLDQMKSLAALASANFILQTGICTIPHRANLLGLHAQLRDAQSGKLIHTSNYFIKEDVMNKALEQTMVKYSRRSSLWYSMLFPGAGHVYRGEQTKGWSYIAAGAILATSAIVSSVLGYQAQQDYLDDDPSTTARRSDANAHYDRANYLWIGLATLWGYTMTENYMDATDQIRFKDPYVTLQSKESR